jgi:hypothetical protein
VSMMSKKKNASTEAPTTGPKTRGGRRRARWKRLPATRDYSGAPREQRLRGPCGQQVRRAPDVEFGNHFSRLLVALGAESAR